MSDTVPRRSKAEEYNLLLLQDEVKSEIAYRRGFYLSLMVLISLVTIVSMYWSWGNVSHFASWSSLFAGGLFMGVAYFSMRDCIDRLSVRIKDIDQHLNSD